MQPIKLFFSFAPQDKIAVNRLEAHLSVLVHNERIKILHAGKILPGADEKHERSTQLKEADIILLVVSSDYTASNQCYKVEAHYAVQMANAGIAHVRWIPYRHVMIDEEAVFSSCPNLLKDGKFLRDWPDKDKPLRQICEDIDVLVSEAFLDRQRREENRTKFGYRLDKTHPIPVMPPLKVNRRITKEPEQSKQAVIQIPEKKKPQKQSKQTAMLAPQKKSVKRTSGTRRKRSDIRRVAQSATVQRTLGINLTKKQISRKFSNNRGIFFITLFMIDVVAMPLTIRSWVDSWLLVGFAFALSALIFTSGTLAASSFLPILLSFVYAGVWGSLILHLFTWPLATWPLVIMIIVLIVVASIHYTLFRKR